MQIPLAKKAQLESLKFFLMQKVNALRSAHKVALGCTSEPGAFDNQPEDKLQVPTCSKWCSWLEPEASRYQDFLMQIMAENPPAPSAEKALIDADKLWVWGGPTPYWGGTMAEDTLLAGADYYNAQNVVYVYGPTNEKTMAMHSKYKRMICQINAACRTPGALAEGNEETNAELLSKLSLQFPNIVGAMCDDSTVGSKDTVEEGVFAKRYAALKKHNDKLRMYTVIYAHELYKNFSKIQPYVDVVNFWIWDKDQMLQAEEYLSLCQEKFPGKPIIAGVFLHEYGVTDAGNSPEFLAYQLDRIREFIHKKVVEGVILLGDREIKKWPTTAAAVKKYLQKQK